MNLSKVFAFDENVVRVAGTPEKPLFVAADICRVLEIKNHRDAVNEFEEDERGVAPIYSPGKSDNGSGSGLQDMLVVTEAGLYRLIFRSDKPAARKFQRWVFSEVLPSIRRTGGYGLDEREKLWSVLDRAKTGDVQRMVLLALGYGDASQLIARAASIREFRKVEPAQVWADIKAGLEAEKIPKWYFKAVPVVFEPDSIELYLLPTVLKELRELNLEHYRIDYRDFRMSMALSDEWVAGSFRQRVGMPATPEVVWKFHAKPDCGIIYEVAQLLHKK